MVEAAGVEPASRYKTLEELELARPEDFVDTIGRVGFYH